MLGTVLNVIAILIGGTVGLARPGRLAPGRESFLRVGLAVFSVYYGLRLTLTHLGGSFLQILKQLLITVLALMIGKLLGRFLRLQAFSNALGRRARDHIQRAGEGKTNPNAGFLTGSLLFCAAPLGYVGALVDGITPGSYPYPLIIKAVMDGMATYSFVVAFGSNVMLSALPVLALQGTISLLSAHYLGPFLDSRGLLASVEQVAGLLVFCVALVILELKKIPLAEYLPALAIAPILRSVFG